MIPIKQNIWKAIESITTKEIKTRLQEKNNNPVNTLDYIKNRHKIDQLEWTNINPFTVIDKITSEEKIRGLQFKLLHNIYPTMYHLNKWKIKESPNCTYCGTTETTIHAIFECPIAKETINNFIELINEKLQIRIRINKTSILLGIEYNVLERDNHLTNAINLVLLLIKRDLILQREHKRIINKEEITRIIKNQSKMEDLLYRKQNKTRIFERRWPENLRR